MTTPIQTKNEQPLPKWITIIGDEISTTITINTHNPVNIESSTNKLTINDISYDASRFPGMNLDNIKIQGNINNVTHIVKQSHKRKNNDDIDSQNKRIATATATATTTTMTISNIISHSGNISFSQIMR